jgi:benzodiazapine receptor
MKYQRGTQHSISQASIRQIGYLHQFGQHFTFLWQLLCGWFGKATYPSNIKNTAILVFVIQLVLNFFWSIIFFSLHQLVFALVEIAFMWVFILLCIIKFYPISRTAAYLLIPYLLWVSFASVLNFAIGNLTNFFKHIEI